jgi:regulator of protease activity HflC (stomatin/prohibitin superfamily)
VNRATESAKPTRRRPGVRSIPAHQRPRGFRSMPRQRALRLGTLALAVMGVLLITMVTGATISRQDVGHVGVVRNGGPFDRRNIRQLLMPAQKLTWTGWFSQDPHEYPSSHVELLYTVTSDPRRGSREGADVVTVPTRDGVRVGLEATIFYHFVGERDPRILRQFDSGLATRRYPTRDGNDLFPWEGDTGFAALMDSVWRPVLENDLRREIGRFRCEQLVASCALLRRATRVSNVGSDPTESSTVNIARVESRITSSLEEDLARTLEAPYFWGIHFRLSAVRLPGTVQSVIDGVHGKYAAVSGSRAEVAAARYEQKRNEILARSYRNSPALARIHAIQAAPKGATIIINDSGTKSPGLNVGG